MNKDSPTGRLFPQLPRYGKLIIDTIGRSKITNHDLSFDIETCFNFLSNFLLNIVVTSVEKIEKWKIRAEKLLRRQAQNVQYNNVQKKWLDLTTDIVLTKVYKKLVRQIKKPWFYSY